MNAQQMDTQQMDNRGPWFIFTGLLLGIALGIGIAWGVPQAQPVDTHPSSLRADFKDEYRFMIAAAYAISGDLGRARARLAVLGDPDPLVALGGQAQRMLAQNASIERVRILANLSEALQSQPLLPAGETNPAETALPPADFTAVPATASATPTATEDPNLPRPSPTSTDTPFPTLPPLPTATLRPTRTPTPTPGAPFVLVNQVTTCDPQTPGLLQVNLKNTLGQPAAGQELVITWFGGEEHFFTGFKNEISPGYADFVLTEGVEYALSLSQGRTRITGLKAPACLTSDGKAYPGSIVLEFRQP
ncbi:MAG: hypothetical protein N2117_07700 [Anaerolineales bacterium]|nr:hypothetical protein [Anaerolineales bacterium]MCX7755116.1 hypothetical protein [Anaerolineales bacterium]MDW8277531.1 hypothetical protein [Anaerolineales bacterium]